MVILFMAIIIFIFGGYWWLFNEWLLVVILLMAIGGYSMNGYWWLFY
jgi:hypothetical protein